MAALVVGYLVRGRTLPGVPFHLRWRFRQTLSRRMGILFVRRGSRLALLAMRSRTLRPARILGTLGAALRVALGLMDRLLKLRFERGLLVGMGSRPPVRRLLRARTYGVFSYGLLGTP